MSEEEGFKQAEFDKLTEEHNKTRERLRKIYGANMSDEANNIMFLLMRMDAKIDRFIMDVRDLKLANAGSHQEQLAGITHRFDRHDVSEIKERTGLLEERTALIHHRIDRLEKRLAEIEKRIDQVDQTGRGFGAL